MAVPKISIIVPVYKAETTIRKCLDSIVSQSLEDWEAILVDDGSPDGSGAVCDEYAVRDSRFRVVHKANGGVSSARQAGLDCAQGEYVIHADPDDWVERRMLEDLYGKAKEDDADMVICDLFSDVAGRSFYKKQAPSSLRSEVVLNDLFWNIHGSCCNKLVKRQCVLQYDVRFPAGVNYCEDLCFNVQLLKQNIKVSYLPQAYYHYVQSESSITNGYTHATFANQKRFVGYLATLLPESSEPVHKSKLLVKKLAFRHSVLPNKELLDLYPDVKKTDDRRCVLKWMYNSAFKGHFIVANALRFAYNLRHK